MFFYIIVFTFDTTVTINYTSISIIINISNNIAITITVIIIHQTFSLARDWSKRVNWANRTCCEKYLKDDKHNGLHLARK